MAKANEKTDKSVDKVVEEVGVPSAEELVKRDLTVLKAVRDTLQEVFSKIELTEGNVELGQKLELAKAQLDSITPK